MDKNNDKYDVLQIETDMKDNLMERPRFTSAVSNKRKDLNENRYNSSNFDNNSSEFSDDTKTRNRNSSYYHKVGGPQIKKRDSKLKFGNKKLTVVDIEKIAIQNEIYDDYEEFYSPRELKKEEILYLSSFSVECSNNTNQNLNIKVYKKSGVKKRESKDNLDILETDILLSTISEKKLESIKEITNYKDYEDEDEEEEDEDDDKDENVKSNHNKHIEAKNSEDTNYEDFFDKMFSSDVRSMYSVIILVIKSIIRYTFFNIPQCFALLGLFNGCMTVLFISIMSIISIYYIMKIHEMKGYT